MSKKNDVSVELDRLTREIEELRRKAHGGSGSTSAALVSPTKKPVKRGRPVGTGLRKAGAKTDQMHGFATTKAEADWINQEVKSSGVRNKSEWIRRKLGL